MADDTLYPARPMQYQEVPADLLESPEDRAPRVDGAVAVAREKRKASTKRPSKKSQEKPREALGIDPRAEP